MANAELAELYKKSASERAKFCVSVFNEVAKQTRPFMLADFTQNEKGCEKAMVIALRNLIQERRNIRLADFVAAISAGRQTEGADGVLEEDEEYERNEQLYLHRSNFRHKLMDPNTTLEEKAHLLFLWRALLQFCCYHFQHQSSDQRQNAEAQLADCRFKLVPTMTEFAQFVGDFLRSGLGRSDSASRDVLATPARPDYPPRQRVSPPRTRSARKRRVDPAAEQRAERQDERAVIHYAMRQLFRIFPLLDMDDVGKAHWRELAFSVLANPTVALSEDFLKELVDSLMNYHYPQDDQAELALREFCDAINNIVTRGDQAPNPLLVNGVHRSPSVSSTSSTPSRDSSQLNPAYPMSKLDDATRIRCLSIFTTLLRSGRFMRNNVELNGLYEVLITTETLSSQSASERALAYQCVTWRCLLNELDAAIFTPIIWHALELHTGRSALPYLDMVGDLVRFYGYARVSKWCQDEQNSKEEVVDDSFMMEDEEERAVAEGRSTQQSQSQGQSQDTNESGGGDIIVEDPEEAEKAREREQQRRRVLEMYIRGEDDPEVALRTTEHLCGWLLSGALQVPDGAKAGARDAEQALAHLLLTVHNEEACSRMHAVHACLAKFMPCFVAVSRRHQQLLVRAFVEAFVQLKELSLALREEARDIEELQLASAVVQLTSHAALADKTVDREKGSVHPEFARLILETVCEQPDELYAAVYLSLLPKLDPVEDLETVHNLLFLCTDTMRHFDDVYEVGTAGKLQHLKAYMRMLNKRADQLQQQKPQQAAPGISVEDIVIEEDDEEEEIEMGGARPAKRSSSGSTMMSNGR